MSISQEADVVEQTVTTQTARIGNPYALFTLDSLAYLARERMYAPKQVCAIVTRAADVAIKYDPADHVKALTVLERIFGETDRKVLEFRCGKKNPFDVILNRVKQSDVKLTLKGLENVARDTWFREYSEQRQYETEFRVPRQKAKMH